MSRNVVNAGSRRLAFASDNCAGICPEAWEAMAEANSGACPSYGDDDWSARACDRMREIFETDCEVFFVFNGTAANSLALSSMCRSYHSIICHASAHVETDECGAPEFFSHGAKVLLARGENGKMLPSAVEEIVNARDDLHYPKPKALSLTQSTELGTVYRPGELDALRESAMRRGLRIHMDGARFANAVATLDVAPKELTWKAGVDALCFGGTKNGMACGEAVVFFNRELAHEFEWRCKQAGQLASKMRFLAAPWVRMLESGAWLDRARHANAMARRLAAELEAIDGVSLTYPVEANAVFLQTREEWLAQMRRNGWAFYTFIGGAARLMCSWNTSEEDISDFVNEVKQAAG